MGTIVSDRKEIIVREGSSGSERESSPCRHNPDKVVRTTCSEGSIASIYKRTSQHAFQGALIDVLESLGAMAACRTQQSTVKCGLDGKLSWEEDRM